MRNHVVRLYALTATLMVFFLSWAAIAARPWLDGSAAGSDPRLAQLAAREAQLRREATLVQQILDRRFADYREALSGREEQNQAIRSANAALAAPPQAAPPQVAVLPVSTQPVTATRSS
jgi:hypothetical protein